MPLARALPCSHAPVLPLPSCALCYPSTLPPSALCLESAVPDLTLEIEASETSSKPSSPRICPHIHAARLSSFCHPHPAKLLTTQHHHHYQRCPLITHTTPTSTTPTTATTTMCCFAAMHCSALLCVFTTPLLSPLLVLIFFLLDHLWLHVPIRHCLVTYNGRLATLRLAADHRPLHLTLLLP
ncbi:hypothetical protein B0J11DRAFT_541676 [Dendryphion nanum]|uniref:Uncharacterized protein n=1 Tax=Dendryphion nanum TaxID=256645 RepID=A0A9P9I9M9_9PLEO|nr:hypothetical protein B0J11DRAFT_541676 [Dendryphion nanum]